MSYEEALKEHKKAVGYKRRPHNARPMKPEMPFAIDRGQSDYSYSESAYDYNFSPPPLKYDEDYKEEKTKPYFFPEKQKDYASGYQGGMNPVFVSKNKEENRLILSKVPTPPPRQYFPVEDSKTSKHWFTSSTTTKKPVKRTTKPYDVDFYDYGYTKEPYQPPYDTTQPTEEQQRYWQEYETYTKVPYMDEEDMWEGYNKVVGDLLQDKRYTRPIVQNPNVFDTNKYIGDPQFISTKPIIVGPSITSSNNGPRQPAVDLITSYSDRYGWTKNDPSRGKPGRKWTSIELAKPVWDEDTNQQKLGERPMNGYQTGSVEQLDIEKVIGMDGKETYGYWNQELNLIPALSRYE